MDTTKESIYCYYISSDFNFAELVVSICSLKATKPRYPIACVYGDKVSATSKEILTALDVRLIDGTGFPLSHTIIKADGKKDEFLCSSKLYLYSFYEYKKIVYLDPDTYILQNLDSVFDYPDGSACKHFMNDGGWANMNGGLMVVVPNEQIFNDFQKQLKLDESRGYHQYPDDQYYLTIKNHFINRTDLHIPYEYNFWPFYISHYIQNRIFDRGAIRMWHFMGGCTLGGVHYKIYKTPIIAMFDAKAQDFYLDYFNQVSIIITILKTKFPEATQLTYPGVMQNEIIKNFRVLQE